MSFAVSPRYDANEGSSATPSSSPPTSQPNVSNADVAAEHSEATTSAHTASPANEIIDLHSDYTSEAGESSPQLTGMGLTADVDTAPATTRASARRAATNVDADVIDLEADDVSMHAEQPTEVSLPPTAAAAARRPSRRTSTNAASNGAQTVSKQQQYQPIDSSDEVTLVDTRPANLGGQPKKRKTPPSTRPRGRPPKAAAKSSPASKASSPQQSSLDAHLSPEKAMHDLQHTMADFNSATEQLKTNGKHTPPRRSTIKSTITRNDDGDVQILEQQRVAAVDEQQADLLQRLQSKEQPPMLQWREVAHAYRLDDYECTSTAQAVIKANCITRPLCLHGMKQKRVGIWSERSTPEHYKAIGSDDVANIRDPKTEYVGLRNLGATCYMNVLMQCLYMNKHFRHTLFQYRSADAVVSSAAVNGVSAAANAAAVASTASGSSDAIVIALQELFWYLQEGLNRCFVPNKIVQLLQIKTHDQQDVNEFNNLFMSFLDTQLANSTNSPKHVREIMTSEFRGALTNVVECQNCHRKSERQDTFYDLSLQIKGKKSVNDAIAHTLAIEELTGGNQYMCSTCQSKQDAKRYTQLTELPPMLNVQLVRFEFDFDELQKKKLQDDIYIPQSINMSQYLNKDGFTAEQLQSLYPAKESKAKGRKPSAKQQSKAKGKQVIDSKQHATTMITDIDELEELAAPAAAANGRHSPPADKPLVEFDSVGKAGDAWYDLVTILKHRGTSANRGHYTAEICNEQKQWFNFDDETVKQIDNPLTKRLAADSSEGAPDAAEVKKTAKRKKPKLTLGSRKPKADADQQAATATDKADNIAERIWGVGMKSRNAYMLVYQRRCVRHTESKQHQPADNIVQECQKANDKLTQLSSKYSESKAQLDQRIEQRKAACDELLNILEVHPRLEPLFDSANAAAKVEGNFISRQWLQRWFSGLTEYDLVAEEKPEQAEAAAVPGDDQAVDLTDETDDANATPTKAEPIEVTDDMEEEGEAAVTKTKADSDDIEMSDGPASTGSGSLNGIDATKPAATQEQLEKQIQQKELHNKMLIHLHAGDLLETTAQLPRCPHQQLDPRQPSAYKLISTLAWQQLVRDNLQNKAAAGLSLTDTESAIMQSGQQPDGSSSETAMCAICAAELLAVEVQADRRQRITAQIKRDISDFRLQHNILGNRANVQIASLPADAVWISPLWLQKWKKFTDHAGKPPKPNTKTALEVNDAQDYCSTHDPLADIMCPHGELVEAEPLKQCDIVSLQLLKELRANYVMPKHAETKEWFVLERKVCSICAQAADKEDEQAHGILQQYHAEVKALKKLLTEKLDDFPTATKPPLIKAKKPRTYYLIPVSFVHQLKHFHNLLSTDPLNAEPQRPGPIDFSVFYCQHNKLLYAPWPKDSKMFDPEQAVYGSEPGQMYALLEEVLVRKLIEHAYLDADPAVPTITASLKSKAVDADHQSWNDVLIEAQPEVCYECVHRRMEQEEANKRQWDAKDSQLTIIKIPWDTAVPSEAATKALNGTAAPATTSSSVRKSAARSTRSTDKSNVIDVPSSINILNLKLRLMEKHNASPNDMKLYYNDFELSDKDRTLESYEVRRDSKLLLKLNIVDQDKALNDQLDKYYGVETGFAGSILQSFAGPAGVIAPKAKSQPSSTSTSPSPPTLPPISPQQIPPQLPKLAATSLEQQHIVDDVIGNGAADAVHAVQSALAASDAEAASLKLAQQLQSEDLARQLQSEDLAQSGADDDAEQEDDESVHYADPSPSSSNDADDDYDDADERRASPSNRKRRSRPAKATTAKRQSRSSARNKPSPTNASPRSRQLTLRATDSHIQLD